MGKTRHEKETETRTSTCRAKEIRRGPTSSSGESAIQAIKTLTQTIKQGKRLAGQMGACEALPSAQQTQTLRLSPGCPRTEARSSGQNPANRTKREVHGVRVNTAEFSKERANR